MQLPDDVAFQIYSLLDNQTLSKLSKTRLWFRVRLLVGSERYWKRRIEIELSISINLSEPGCKEVYYFLLDSFQLPNPSTIRILSAVGYNLRVDEYVREAVTSNNVDVCKELLSLYRPGELEDGVAMDLICTALRNRSWSILDLLMEKHDYSTMLDLSSESGREHLAILFGAEPVSISKSASVVIDALASGRYNQAVLSLANNGKLTALVIFSLVLTANALFALAR